MTFVYGPTTCTIYGTVYPLDLEFTRKQNFQLYEDGEVTVYDRDQEQKFIVLTIRDDHTNHDNIRDFIITTVNFRETTFTFTPDAGVDAGAGEGTAVNVKYWGSNFIENMIRYQHYEYRILLRRV